MYSNRNLSLSIDQGINADGKKLTGVPIWQWNPVQCLIPFSYVIMTNWQWWTICHCIPSCSLNLRQMPSKTYHSVEGNVTYKVMPSLLMSRQPHHNHTSNRLPLLPPLFRGEINTQPFGKGTELGGFFLPKFWTFCPNFCTRGTNNFWENLPKFANNLKNELFEGRDELFEQWRFSYPSSWTTFSKPKRPHEAYVPQEKCMCCCKRSRTVRSSIRMGWYHMFSEASAERFVLRARSSPSCASECV